MSKIRYTWAWIASFAVIGLACPSDEEGGGQSCTQDADCQSLGQGYVCGAAGTCVPTPGTSGDSDATDSDGPSEDSTTGEAESSSSGTTMAPTTADPSTTPPETTVDPDADNCDPDAGPFLLDAEILRNSVSFDFGAGSCAVTQLDGQDPRIDFEVRQTTGRIDATAYGIEITDATVGQVFDTPPMGGDSQVIDMPVDLAITFMGTAIADGTPLTFEFEVSSMGPALIDCAATYE